MHPGTASRWCNRQGSDTFGGLEQAIDRCLIYLQGDPTLRQPDPSKEALTIDSAERFAVIGPGNPYPELLASSNHSFSDLVGYYSLREAGLGSLVSDRYHRTRTDPFSIVGRLLWSKRTLERDRL